MQSLAILRAGCRKGRCKSRTKCPHPIPRSPSADPDLKSGFQICVTLPVPGRSNVGKRRRCNKIGFVGILGACCARGRAHSGAVTSAATDPTTCQAISSSKSSQDSGSLQTVMNGTSYEMILWWSDEDAAYVVEVPELPGCMTHGKTRPTPSARLR